MNIKLLTSQTITAKYLHCYIGARYWEDSDFNGIPDDENGTEARKLFGADRFEKWGGYEFLHLTIDLDRGRILDWPKDTTAHFGYKSCDINRFVLEGTYPDGSKAKFSTPEEDTEYFIGPDCINDYGDYFVAKVDAQGNILDYNKQAMINALEDWIESHKLNK